MLAQSLHEKKTTTNKIIYKNTAIDGPNTVHANCVFSYLVE